MFKFSWQHYWRNAFCWRINIRWPNLELTFDIKTMDMILRDTRFGVPNLCAIITLSLTHLQNHNIYILVHFFLKVTPSLIYCLPQLNHLDRNLFRVWKWKVVLLPRFCVEFCQVLNISILLLICVIPHLSSSRFNHLMQSDLYSYVTLCTNSALLTCQGR